MHRLPGGSVGGKWEFPGGKCESGETPQEALRREWLEETDFVIAVGPELARGRFHHKGAAFELIAFEAVLPDGAGEPALREHDDYRWVLPEELGGLDLVESDRALLEGLKL